MYQCKICGLQSEPERRRAREMMFGFRDEFDYAECERCGSVQLIEVPADLARYYPADYYSFKPPLPSNRLKRYLQVEWFRHLVGDRSPVGWLVTNLRTPRYELLALRHPKVGRDARILDVGSGVGGVLDVLVRLGFRDLTGVDPFLPANANARGVRLLRCGIEALNEPFSVIFFNHSLEHIPDPVDALRHAARLLTAEGRIIVRTPLAAHTWKGHGTNWVELDPPRHLVVFSERGMAVAAERAGLKVRDVRYDSTAFEIWATRQYQMDIPLTDARSYGVNPSASPFARRDIQGFESEIAALNRSGQAGRACFTLLKA